MRAYRGKHQDGRSGMTTVICTVCRTRLSYDDGTHAHPHCRDAAPLTDAEMARLVHALGGLLGATPLTTETRP